MGEESEEKYLNCMFCTGVIGRTGGEFVFSFEKFEESKVVLKMWSEKR